MILLLRGHIRNSFKDHAFYGLVKNICLLDDTLEIYIHTWNILQNTVSWRSLDENNTTVTEAMILEYFGDLASRIKHIIIENDADIKLIGNVEGRLPKSILAPLIGWKRYWYSTYQVANYVYCLGKIDPTREVINCRFDILRNSNSIKPDIVLEFIKKHKGARFLKNCFNRRGNGAGVDNIYIGSIETQHKLVSHFYFNLDSILQTSEFGQELIVPEQNDLLFPSA